MYIKFSPFGSRGWPDTILVFPGGFTLWVEFKRPGKKPRKLQYHRIAQLRAQGALAEWFNDADVCINYLQDCLDSALEVQSESSTDSIHHP